MSALSSYDLSVADVLLWEAWPEEMKRIARAAVAAEVSTIDDEERKVIREGAAEDQEVIDQAQYAIARRWMDNAMALLKAEPPDVAGAIEAIDNIPERLDEIDE